MDIEHHPLKPFIPEGARVLMLGSFPPAAHRWSMQFFYPNIQNDMWRIFGLIYFANTDRFIHTEGKRKMFMREPIVQLMNDLEIAIFDTAMTIRRMKGTAADNDLRVMEVTDLDLLASHIPNLEAVLCTGGKAGEICAEQMLCEVPAPGFSTHGVLDNREILLYRMPSTSRAYPLSLVKKAEVYRHVLVDELKITL